MHRRNFLATAATMSAAFFQNESALGQRPQWLTPEIQHSGWQQQNPYHRPLEFELVGFDAQQSQALRAAVKLVAQRMLDPRMLVNADQFYKISQVAPPKVSGVVLKSEADFERWFQKTQLAVLLEKGFPKLTINNANLSSKINGQAPIGTVRVEWTTPSNGFALRPFATVQGEFRIDINGVLLSQALGATNRWAGVICHEMLHNMGHTHNGKKDDNEGYFIDSYQEAVEYNGAWNPATTGWYLAGPARGCCGV